MSKLLGRNAVEDKRERIIAEKEYIDETLEKVVALILLGQKIEHKKGHNAQKKVGVDEQQLEYDAVILADAFHIDVRVRAVVLVVQEIRVALVGLLYLGQYEYE